MSASKASRRECGVTYTKVDFERIVNEPLEGLDVSVSNIPQDDAG